MVQAKRREGKGREGKGRGKEGKRKEHEAVAKVRCGARVAERGGLGGGGHLACGGRGGGMC